jgi:hypothetical protein
MVCDIDARDYPGCSDGFWYRWGRCVPRPTSCEDEPDVPVCGCDRVLYRSDCSRLQAGAFLGLDVVCGSR